jgi:glycosyltransferase involved in cell wall biosynthesis
VQDLAIVIPAFKGRYLHAALASMAAQTDQRFQLYVCDDASPDDLGAIYAGVFPAAADERRNFIRFDENLGGRSLVQQWNRCVAQTRGEPWIWLFSDDDIADPNCVSAFYRVSQADRAHGEDAPVYRFDTAIIDGDGYCVAVSPPHPARESGLQFAYHRMLWQRNSFAPDHIFARDAFERCGGFVDLPFAIGSDDASWITFSEGSLIRTIEGPLVYWRRTTENTSRVSGGNSVEKLLGFVNYTTWLVQRFAGQVFPPGEVPSRIDLGQLIRRQYLTCLHDVQTLLSPAEIESIAATLHEKLGFTRRSIRFRLYRSNLRFAGKSLGERFKAWLG